MDLPPANENNRAILKMNDGSQHKTGAGANCDGEEHDGGDSCHNRAQSCVEFVSRGRTRI